MSKLPFLEPKGWPKLRKMSGVSKYGYSEEDEMVESALDELIQAVQSKDNKQFMEALKALIDCIMAREDESNAPDSLKETSSI
jgi:hypothetical protein